jgi:6-phosphogluconolactonase
LGKKDSEIIAMATDPLGNFMYAADAKNNEILTYWINTISGYLENAKESHFKVGRRPTSISFHPNGKWAYVVNNLDNTIEVFSINALYGNLVKKLQTVDTLALPLELKIDASGRFAYLRYHGSEKISRYTIDETSGRLTHQQDVSLNGQVTNLVLDRWLQ